MSNIPRGLEGVVSSDFRVGPWLVQPGLNTVSHNSTSLRLEPKVMEVLVRLAQHPGEPVCKEQLLQAVWPDTFVSDDVLVRSVSELRRVFEDDAKEARFIQTIPKRGYRLGAPVSAIAGAAANTPAAELADSGKLVKHNWKLAWVTVAGLVPLCGILVGFNVGDLRARMFGSNPPIHSLAVLPLKNLSDDPSQKYFASGMTEELITDLSQISALRVISRTSSETYENTSKPLPEIARELHVDAIVEGSVLRSGDRIRITAQLIYAPSDTSVWAQTYNRDLHDVLSLESAVARAIADEIRVKMSPREQARLQTNPVNLQSHDLYLQGNFYLSQPRSCEKAIEYFQRAVAIEPNARGYVGLAQAYQCLSSIDAEPKQTLPKAQAAAMQALQLDEDLSDAHLVLAEIKEQYDWDWAGAEREFRRAIELNPSSSEAHLNYAWLLDSMRRMPEGEKEHLLAQQVDPFNEQMNEFFYHTRQYDRAIEVLQKYAARHPEDAGVCWQLGILYDYTGRHDEAIACWERMFDGSGYEAEYGLASALRRGFARSGHEGALRELLKTLEAVSRQRHVPPDFMTFWYESLGDKDQAFRWLAKAIEERNSEVQGLNTDLEWDGLRSDPRFADLVRRVGLPD
jgi:TolB-like protein/DNA-binding winged helix-turn-helix (wHTH) protein/tetratricopeptide (TPR) repeat protein